MKCSDKTYVYNKNVLRVVERRNGAPRITGWKTRPILLKNFPPELKELKQDLTAAIKKYKSIDRPHKRKKVVIVDSIDKEGQDEHFIRKTRRTLPDRQTIDPLHKFTEPAIRRSRPGFFGSTVKYVMDMDAGNNECGTEATPDTSSVENMDANTSDIDDLFTIKPSSPEIQQEEDADNDHEGEKVREKHTRNNEHLEWCATECPALTCENLKLSIPSIKDELGNNSSSSGEIEAGFETESFEMQQTDQHHDLTSTMEQVEEVKQNIPIPPAQEEFNAHSFRLVSNPLYEVKFENSLLHRPQSLLYSVRKCSNDSRLGLIKGNDGSEIQVDSKSPFAVNDVEVYVENDNENDVCETVDDVQQVIKVPATEELELDIDLSKDDGELLLDTVTRLENGIRSGNFATSDSGIHSLASEYTGSCSTQLLLVSKESRTTPVNGNTSKIRRNITSFNNLMELYENFVTEYKKWESTPNNTHHSTLNEMITDMRKYLYRMEVRSLKESCFDVLQTFRNAVNDIH